MYPTRSNSPNVLSFWLKGLRSTALLALHYRSTSQDNLLEPTTLGTHSYNHRPRSRSIITYRFPLISLTDACSRSSLGALWVKRTTVKLTLSSS